jgi:hypothetical protein
MNLEEILAAVDKLPPDDLERLKAHLNRTKTSSKPRTVEEWMAKFNEIADEFRGDSSDEEMRDLIAAMNMKSPPSEKGL